ncbi:conserved hypothetical protein [Perkinsus marinus ATCC 50983]|uniref:Uncharacterized protein n=1 Tax=Perkinsus marinus (strain ATCC 50983 / TXsc) TaxID=423536 RepID=C5LWZ0_PERM5|nr:conserved hypothetical protein [Perkinsus marinus ATCC 50983]EEQ98768.1 conserved hypothetical protein [Perkinsus marinus ATCC 50983]|eukprot:XP_002766051.1 conserved hypothetical protein [Perkinsus marinus ATCC 50983]
MFVDSYSYLIAATIVTLAAALVGKVLSMAIVGANKKSSGPRPMTWMEEHMFLADCFPKEANLPATCNVINCAVLFKDAMPDRESIDKLVREKLLSFTRFSCVPDVKTHSWKPVDIDVAQHVLTSAPIKSRAALDDKIEEIINVPLLTDKPLWQIHLLPAAQGAEQKDCVLFRSHHTIGDGISLIQLLDAVAVSRDGGPITYVNPKEKKPIKMSLLTKLVYGVLFSLEWVRSLIANVLQTKSCFETEYGFNSSLAHRKGDLTYSGARKSICFKPFSLDYVKAIKNRSPKKTTVNDVLLGAMVGAMRRYGGSAVDNNTVMRMLVPVGAPLEFGPNPPPEGDRLGNNFSFCSVDLSEAIRSKDSISRMLASSRPMNHLKKSLEFLTSMFITNTILPLMPKFVPQGSSMDLFSRHSIVFSNVPGMQTPCCFAGKEVESIYPIFLNIITQVIVLSYNRKLMFNITLDPNVVKDYDKFEGYYRDELLDMGERLGVTDVQL